MEEIKQACEMEDQELERSLRETVGVFETPNQEKNNALKVVQTLRQNKIAMSTARLVEDRKLLSAMDDPMVSYVA
jgi:hypothetical protein